MLTMPEPKPYSCGTYSSYTLGRCRCDLCRQASNDYQNQRARLIAYGRWEGLTDAEPVRQHVQTLRSSGLGVERIATLADVSRSALGRLLYGEPRRNAPPSSRVSEATARKILAVRPLDALIAPGAQVNATGTRRRLQALATLGWSARELGTRCGMFGAHFQRVIRVNRMVFASTHLAVVALYDELWDTPPPENNRAESSVRARIRNHAARNGWAPPMAWDDDTIDDPAARPDLGTKTKRTVALAEDADELIRDQGYTLQHAAERLGVDRNHLQIARARANKRQTTRRTSHRGTAALTS